jgi:hypothetical protein
MQALLGLGSKALRHNSRAHISRNCYVEILQAALNNLTSSTVQREQVLLLHLMLLLLLLLWLRRVPLPLMASQALSCWWWERSRFMAFMLPCLRCHGVALSSRMCRSCWHPRSSCTQQ